MFAGTRSALPLMLGITLVTGTSCLGMRGVRADEPATATDPDSPNPSVPELVEQLFDARFAVRNRAAGALLRVGIDAEAELVNARGATEVKDRQLRLDRLLEQIRGTEFQKRLTHFHAMPNPARAQRLPEWTRFSALCGDSKESLEVFGVLMESDPELYTARLFDAAKVPALLQSRSQALQSHLAQKSFPSAECLNLLLLGSDGSTRLPGATSANISEMMKDPRLAEILRDGVQRRVFESLLNEWILRPNINTEYPLIFAASNDLAAGRKLAARILQSGSQRNDAVLALLYFAVRGDQTALPLIEAAFESDRVVWPDRNGKVARQLSNGLTVDSNYRVKLCDMALVVALKIRRQDPAEFGIQVSYDAEAQRIPGGMDISRMGFESEETRSAAFDRYAAQFLELTAE
ncbi:MAG: hypothetical protein KDA96_16350 [Planctomycetaceae bacterium]|nr:hypothetical protein [Planctomycetaceae bacterium]